MSGIIVADIGGTHTRFGLWTGEDITDCIKWKTADYATVPEAIDKYRKDHDLGNVKDFAFAVAANQFDDGVWRFTNHDGKSFSIPEIEQAGYRVLASENDFVATAFGCLALAASDKRLLPVKGGQGARNSAKVILGPGTGLGMAYGFEDKGHLQVRRTHGGHMLFTPVTDMHIDLSRRVAEKKKLDRPVIFEDIACGGGFPFLYQACCDLNGEKPSAHFFDNTEQASFKMALSVFHDCLGLFTHTCVLTLQGYGGVYLNGGFLDTLMERGLWNPEQYLKGFLQKGVPIVNQDLAKTPVCIVADNYISLTGLGKMINA